MSISIVSQEGGSFLTRAFHGLPNWIQTWLRDDVWGVFLNGFAVGLLPSAILLFLIWVIGFRGLRAFGVPGLFRRNDFWQHFFISIGVVGLVWQVFLAGYLFEPLATNYTYDRPPFCDHRSAEEGWQALQKQKELHKTNPTDTSSKWSEEDRLRFRYHPMAVVTFGLYVLHVFLGSLGLVVILGLLYSRSIFKRVLAFLDQPTIHVRPNSSFATPRMGGLLGTIFGIGILVFVTSEGFSQYTSQDVPCYEKKFEVMDKESSFLNPVNAGYQLVKFGGWGEAAARSGKLGVYINAEKNLTEKPDLCKDEATKEAPGEKGENKSPENKDEKLKLQEKIAHDQAITDTRWALRPYFGAFGLFLFIYLAVLAFSLIPYLVGWLRKSFSPAVGILLLIHTALAMSVLFSYFVAFPHLAFITPIFVILWCGLRYKLRFSHLPNNAPLRTLESYYREVQEADQPPVPVEQAVAPPAPTQVLKNLLRTDDIEFGELKPTPIGKLPPMVVICASGGGSRAAAWTMKMLTLIEQHFEKENIAFPYHIRLVTGASGGMIGAGYYVASLAEPLPGPISRVQRVGLPDQNIPELTIDHLNASICEDFLTPTVHQMIYGDIPSLFMPTTKGFDRGKAIEKSWSQYLFGQMQKSFENLLEGEKKGWRPSLIFSPFIIEDGRQLLISNLSLGKVTTNRAHVLGESVCNPSDNPLLSREGIELFKLFPQANQFTVGTAARMSASFPFIMPAVELPTDPPRRIVDAGYFDNYGIGIAASWLFTHKKWIRENTSGVVVIQIRDGVSEDQRKMYPRNATSAGATPVNRPDLDSPDHLSLGAQWATSPIEGLLSVRTGTNLFRNDNLLHLLDLFFNGDTTEKAPGAAEDAFFATVAFECEQGDEIPLTFVLSEEEKRLIDLASDPPTKNQKIQNRLDALLKWWDSRPDAPKPVSKPTQTTDAPLA